MAFGMEAVIPIELDLKTALVAHFDESENDACIGRELDLLEERRETSQIRLAAYQAQAARFYNKKVKLRRFNIRDLVLRKVMPNTKPKNVVVLGPNWEGPYRVARVLKNGAYALETLDSNSLGHPWNAEHLKFYYS